MTCPNRGRVGWYRTLTWGKQVFCIRHACLGRPVGHPGELLRGAVKQAVGCPRPEFRAGSIDVGMASI